MSAASSSHNVVSRNDDISVQGDVTSVTSTVHVTVQHQTTTPQCIAVSSSLSVSRSHLSHKYDPSKSCAPLVINCTRKRSNSRSPSQITIRASPSEVPTQHPDMIAMLQELDLELANQNQIQGSTYPEEVLEDTLTVYYSESAAPLGPNALESLGNVSNSTYYSPHSKSPITSPHRESPITSLAVGAPVVQRPSMPDVSPMPLVSPPSGTISFVSFFKRSRSDTVSVPQTYSGRHSVVLNASPPVLEPPPLGMISVRGFFKRSRLNTIPVSQTNFGCRPRRLRLLA